MMFCQLFDICNIIITLSHRIMSMSSWNKSNYRELRCQSKCLYTLASKYLVGNLYKDAAQVPFYKDSECLTCLKITMLRQ